MVEYLFQATAKGTEVRFLLGSIPSLLLLPQCRQFLFPPRMNFPESAKAKRHIMGSLCIIFAPFTTTVEAQHDRALVPTAELLEADKSHPAPPPSSVGASSSQINPVLPATSDASTINSASGTGFLQDPLRWGPFELRPHFDYQLYSASQVYVQPGETQDTIRHSISPGLLLQGRHFSFDYTPRLNYYSRGRFKDGIDHSVTFDAHVGLGDWRFAAAHDYSKSSQVLIETARQTETERHTTSLNAAYRYSEKTTLDFNLNQTIILASSLNNSRHWSTMNWINYLFSDTTTFGVGAGAGFADVEVGSDMTYEMLQARVGWNPGSKLSFDLNGGVEVRQFIDGAPDRVNPLVGVALSYRLFEQTRFSLGADRSVNTSLLQDQITEITSVSASFNQRLFGRLNASLSGGHRTSDYQVTSRSLFGDRTDETSHLGLTLGTAFLQRGLVSVGYRYLKNESSEEGFGFTSNQYTLNVGYRF